MKHATGGVIKDQDPFFLRHESGCEYPWLPYDGQVTVKLNADLDAVTFAKLLIDALQALPRHGPA